MFPSADRIATAIVMAARFHGDDPLSIASGVPGGRSRVLAYAALTEAWPQARKAGLSRCCAFISPAAASAHLNNARKARWWNEDLLDEIVGALVEEDYASRDVPEASPPVAPAGRATTRDGRSPLRPSADVEIPHFEADERRLIARMRAGGADAGAIAAALGASSDEVGAWLAANG
ncbi:MAG: hypothetical protein J0H53_05410 [Rhizobiales bacterium]|nr:hypothetical protein [Hyphomicrobiales bacterium]OJU37156.1 MAG: hypothetical protein BGN94_08185 [Rhizobiales bacterium 68-8]